MQNARTTFMTIFLIYGLFNSHSIADAVKIRNSSTVISIRNPKIMYGLPTKDGEFKWQASLNLLHPAFGNIGHWCGGVLIRKNWVLSAAHCIHNDLFNLPLPAVWTVVLGEYNMKVESGLEQRIPVDKIVMHEKYHNFKNDLVLMKLSKSAKIGHNVDVIKLPSMQTQFPHQTEPDSGDNYEEDEDSFDRNQNYLRKLSFQQNLNNLSKRIQEINTKEASSRLPSSRRPTVTPPVTPSINIQTKNNRRRNDKFFHYRPHDNDKFGFKNDFVLLSSSSTNNNNQNQYIECVATGWGKYSNTDQLSDILLQTKVPIHNIKKCEDVYGDFVRLNQNQHLCAGNLNGKSGACVGDSGGGMQCKLKKTGPWILVGITSFGSGCSMEGYPDVFTNVAYYRKWIENVIRTN